MVATIDAMLDMAKHEKQIDVFSFVANIRKKKPTAVQTLVSFNELFATEKNQQALFTP